MNGVRRGMDVLPDTHLDARCARFNNNTCMAWDSHSWSVEHFTYLWRIVDLTGHSRLGNLPLPPKTTVADIEMHPVRVKGNSYGE